jgi:CIC family chloride channel protein
MVSVCDLKQRFQLNKDARKWLLLDLLGAVAGIVGGLGAIVFRVTLDFNRWLFFDLLLPKI